MAWFLDQNDLHGDGMATAPLRPVPDAAAASLRERPHGAALGQAIVAPRASHR